MTIKLKSQFRAAIFFTLIINGAPAFASACAGVSKFDGYRMVVSETSNDRTYFYPTYKDATQGSKPLRSYVISGDLVAVSLDSKREGAICARFSRSEHDKIPSDGWLKTSSLVELYSDPAALPEKAKKALRKIKRRNFTDQKFKRINELPQSEEINYQIIFRVNDKLAGQKEFDLSGGKDTVENFLKADFSQGFVPVKELEGRCQAIIYQLNNAFVVKTNHDFVCYGNHGYSDPDGVYQEH